MSSLSRILPAAALLAFGSSALMADVELADLAHKVGTVEKSKDSQIQELRSVRRYVLRNARWKNDGVMTVLMTQDRSGQKRYSILDMTAEGIQKQVFTKLLDGEVEAARTAAENGDITPENYQITPVGRERINGRDCIVVQLKPLRKSKALLEGKAWIDARDFAPVRVSGRPSRSFGFWVGKPAITQDFRKVGEFWLSSHNHSVADVKLVGKTELSIEFMDYSVVPRAGDVLMACAVSCSPRLMD